MGEIVVVVLVVVVVGEVVVVVVVEVVGVHMTFPDVAPFIALRGLSEDLQTQFPQDCPDWGVNVKWVAPLMLVQYVRHSCTLCILLADAGDPTVLDPIV